MKLIKDDDLINALNKHRVVGRFNTIELIKNMPDATPKDKRQSGNWIDKDIYYECPYCHAGYMKSICEKTLELSKMNFCFNCGAMLREADNEQKRT